ncbi:MAG TPA: aminoacetone oxidase family FAD-binding enzyme [Vicinamibacterales bacterium]|nr:aminoacetone oxidase family FAD-binding enzyme [Vicinamibacterales bacterium]
MPRIVVIGAGAAGTMASIFAASTGAETVLLESTKDGGRKILISGGGRCNILPSRLDEARFVTDSSPRTLRHIVRSWPLNEQIAFFEQELHLPLVEEPESLKLFPKSQRARDVRDKLLAFARHKGVTLITDTLVTDLRPTGNGWTIERDGGKPMEADVVVVATGGLSVPSTGSDGRGLEFVKRLGHLMHPTYAALTPLTVGSGFSRTPPPFSHLSGISLPVTLTAQSDERKAVSTGGFIFTHDGYSGPSVLDVSHVAVRSLAESPQPARITVQWTALDDEAWTTALRPIGTRTVTAAVGAHLPRRLADALIAQARIDPALPLAQLTRANRAKLIEVLGRGPLPWMGDEGYKKAEVTGGGVSLSEIDPKTMESRTHKGLFLCGEMLDAFGPIGGYNFLWAWVTGRAAGIGAAKAAARLTQQRG